MRWITFPLAAAPVLFAAALSSCKDPSADRFRRELSAKEAELEELKSELGKLKDGSGKAGDSAAKELEKAREESQSLKKQTEDLESEGRSLQEEIERLRKDNEKLKQEAAAKIRKRAVGESHPEITGRNGKVYRQVSIRKVDDFGVSIAHEAGMTTLRTDTAPDAWIARFRLIDEPVWPAASAPPAAPVAASTSPVKSGKSTAGAGAESRLGGVLLVETEGGSGSAFVVIQDGSTYLYTAAHVLAAGKKLVVKNADGAAITSFGACQVAADSDLARIAVNVKPELAIPIMKPGTVAIGREILAVGNSAGSGVLKQLDGTVTALGPTELEVSAAVIQGNSGGPVLAADSGEVIGVVSRAEAGREDIWAADSDFSKVRRFACRIDRPVQWHTVPLDSLQSENTRIAAFDSRTRLMFAMAALEPGQNGLRLDMRLGGGKGPTIMAIFQEHRNLGPVQRLIQMNRQLGDKQLRTSERDLKKRFATFYRDQISLFANDTSGFEPVNFSFSNRKPAEESQEWRKEATKLLGAAAATLGR